MNSWITRGLQIAVLSGGMWALGAGIASADTLVANPPGTSLISVPITANQNSFGRLGTAPDSSTAGTNGALINVPVTVCGNGVGVLGNATGACTTPIPAPAPTTGSSRAPLVDVPVTVCGNGAGVLGNGSGACTTPTSTTPTSTTPTSTTPTSTTEVPRGSRTVDTICPHR